MQLLETDGAARAYPLSRFLQMTIVTPPCVLSSASPPPSLQLGFLTVAPFCGQQPIHISQLGVAFQQSASSMLWIKVLCFIIRNSVILDSRQKYRTFKYICQWGAYSLLKITISMSLACLPDSNNLQVNILVDITHAVVFCLGLSNRLLVN